MYRCSMGGFFKSTYDTVKIHMNSKGICAISNTILLWLHFGNNIFYFSVLY